MKSQENLSQVMIGSHPACNIPMPACNIPMKTKFDSQKLIRLLQHCLF